MDLTVIPELTFNFAFACLVVQHIPSYRVIKRYVQETQRLLAPGGLYSLNPAVEFALIQVRPLFAANPTAAQFTIMIEKAWLGCHCGQIG